MADCAEATIDVWPLPDMSEPADDAEEEVWARYDDLIEPLRVALAGVGVDPDTLEPLGGRPRFDGDVDLETLEDGSRRLEVTIYDSPWGINNEDVEALLFAARACGLAWFARDGGHYTWDPYSEWWHPDMEASGSSKTNLDGDIVLSSGEYNRLLKLASEVGSIDYVDLGRLVAAHFQEPADVFSWRPPAVEVPS